MNQVKLKFDDFRNECGKVFHYLRQLHPHFTDLRIYDSLPYDKSKEVYKHNAEPRWWFMFEYMKGSHIIMSCNPVTDYCEFYTDEYALQEEFEFSLGGGSYGSVSLFSFGSGYVSSLGMLSMYVNMLSKSNGGHLGNKMHITDANNTTAWQNGDTPLEQEPEHLSFIRLIDNIREAKKDPDPAWRGMQLEVRLKGPLDKVDYLVKF